MNRSCYPISQNNLTDSPLTDNEKSSCIDFDDLSDDVDIPDFIKKHNAVLRFPDKLMLLLTFVERESIKKNQIPEKACIAWTRDGKAFIIRDRDDLVNNYLPRIFHIHKAKFASFTRKLYRWGFRQVILRAKDDRRTTENDKIFVHEDFHRDNKKQLANMRSITAEGTRRAYSTFVTAPSEESLPIQYHRKLIEEIGRATLKRAPPSSGLSPQQQEILLPILTQSPSSSRFHPTPTLSGLSSCLSGLPLFTGIVEQQPGLALSLMSSTASRRAEALNLPFRQPTAPYTVEPLLHPVVHSALLLGRQRQHAEDVARARQFLATMLEQPHGSNTFL